MRIRIGQDLATGLLFILVGIGSLWVGWDYPMGSTQRPGTGVLPHILSWCLIGTGVIVGIKGILADQEALTQWAWRPLIMVTVATVAFGLLIDDLGIVVTMIISLTLCALGTPETRWLEYALFLAIMIAMALGLFIWLLGMPIPVWPVRVPAWLHLGR